MRLRSIAFTSSAIALVVLAIGLITAPAADAVAYRYWTYWQGTDAGWTFATAGPATTVPADGSVEGWRFAVTTRSGSSSDAPSLPPEFESICATTSPMEGMKRVALVLDPGPPGIAPTGQVPPRALTSCVQAEPDATGYEVLRTVVTVRTEGGLICGIDEYPTGECAPVIDEASTAAPTEEPVTPSASRVDVAAAASAAMPSPAKGAVGGGTPLATIAVAVLLLVAAAIGAVRYRRAANRDDHA